MQNTVYTISTVFIGFTDNTVYTTYTPNLTLTAYTAFTSGTAYTYTMLEQLNTLFYFDTMGFGSLCCNLVTTTRAFAVLINGLHKSRNPPIQDRSTWRTWETCKNGQLGGNAFLLMMMIYKDIHCVFVEENLKDQYFSFRHSNY